MADMSLFERNLALLQSTQPNVGRLLSGYVPQSQLVYDEDGEPDVEFRGMRLYAMGAGKYARRPKTEPWQYPHRFTLGPPQIERLDPQTGDFMKRYLRRAVDAGMTFKTLQTSQTAYHLVVLGIGLGAHINGLIDLYQSRHVVLVEPNVEFLYQSLFVFDWTALAERCATEGRAFNIVVSDSPDEISLIVRTMIKNANAVSVDGTVVQVHYPSPTLLATGPELDKQIGLMLSGFGFMEDEFHMISNTYANLEDGTARVLKWRRDEAYSLPVLVVGSGGSFDESVEDIRRLSDRALVVSCGTALRPMLMAGIKPDVHIELERDDVRYDILSELIEGFDVRDIWLVGSSTVWPEFRRMFPKRLYYFRPALSAFPLFGLGPDSGLHQASPTVTNAALCFAQSIGARQIYFFGVDMSTRDPDRHHSRNSWQYTQAHEYVYRGGWDMELPGNFGGTVLTNDVLMWAHDELEMAIRAVPGGRKYFNCSDGARIAGALPKLPKSVQLPEPSRPKKQLVEQLMTSFPCYAADVFKERWRDGALYRDLEEAAVELIDAIERHRDHLLDLSYLVELMADYSVVTQQLPVEKLVLRGTVLMVLMCGEYFLSRLEQVGRREELARIMGEEFIRTFEEMGAQACDDLRAMIEERVALSRRAAEDA